MCSFDRINVPRAISHTDKNMFNSRVFTITIYVMVSHIYGLMYLPFQIYGLGDIEKQQHCESSEYKTMQHYGAILNMELVVVSVISVCKIQKTTTKKGDQNE